jgi:hypothetical protein
LFDPTRLKRVSGTVAHRPEYSTPKMLMQNAKSNNDTLREIRTLGKHSHGLGSDHTLSGLPSAPEGNRRRTG